MKRYGRLTRIGLTLAASCVLTISAIGQETIDAPSEKNSAWYVQADLVFAQARFSDATAMTILDENLNGDSRASSIPFEYGFAAAPRVSLEYQTTEDIGLRGSWWRLTNDSDRIQANPPASGFGEVYHPSLFGVDLSSVVPAESLAAESQFALYSIDLEVTKRASLAHWEILAAAGLRHAAIEQQSGYELRNVANAVAGQATLNQQTSGIGPTLSLTSRRLAWQRLALSTMLRASLLIAQSDVKLFGNEDLDLPTPFTTIHQSSSNDILPIIETRWQGEWLMKQTRAGLWTCSGGVEAQWWSGVGTVSDPSADMAILGLTLGTAWNW